MGGVLGICQQIPCGSQFYYKNRETIRAFFLKTAWADWRAVQICGCVG
jgi:hypothetical protein